MAKSRNSLRPTIENRLDRDKELRKSRSQGTIKHYSTPKMKYPPKSFRDTLRKSLHIWSAGDRYWKLAARHYNDPTLWWVIAWYNLKPTDAHCKVGDNIIIPSPIGKILQYYSTT